MQYWQWHTDGSDALVERDEVRVLSQRGVALYDGDAKTNWTHGTLTLTSHKLIYADAASAAVLLLPLATTSSSGDSPSCSRGLAFRSDKVLLPLPAGRYCKLSFRDGGMREFYDALLRVLRQQLWRNSSSSSGTGSNATTDKATRTAAAHTAVVTATNTTRGDHVAHEHATTVTPATTTTAAAATPGAVVVEAQTPALRDAHALGVAGVVRASAESAQVRETLADIDDVMRKASALVDGIRLLRQKATAASADGGGKDGAAAAAAAADLLALDSIEATLGLGTLVTRHDASPNTLTRLGGNSSSSNSSSSSSSFHAELANELHAWLTHPRNAARLRDTPIVPLIELFALYNRARSGDLVSPDDVLGACKQLHKRPGGSAYALTTFASGRMALVHEDTSLLLLRLASVLGPRLVASPAPHTRTTTTATATTAAAPAVVATTKATWRAHVPVRHTLPSGTGGDTLASIDDAQLATLLRVAVPVAHDVLCDLEMQGYLCSSDLGFGCSAYHWNVFVY